MKLTREEFGNTSFLTLKMKPFIKNFIYKKRRILRHFRTTASIWIETLFWNITCMFLNF